MDRRAAISLGTTMAAAFIMFAGCGHYLDNKYATTQPWFTLAGIFYAFFYSGYEVWKIVRQADADESDEDKES
jgi:F0F1-type ATP synthase assembly protein I